MDNINPLLSEANNILNDEDYVGLINNVSSSIYEYALATKANFQEIQNIFKLMDDELKENKDIINFLNISKSNENNLNAFFSDAKISFKNLKLVRKEYLSKVYNYINLILSEKNEKEKTMGKRQYSQGNLNHRNHKEGDDNINRKGSSTINLLSNLKKYIDIIGLYSEEDKEQYINLINLLFGEFKKYEYRDNQEENLDQINEEIKNYKIIINKYKKSDAKLRQNLFSLQKQLNNLNQNNENNLLPQLEKALKFNNQLKEEMKRERLNSMKKDKKIKELKEQNNVLNKINKENENIIINNENKLLSLSEESQIYKLKINELNRINTEKKDIINNLKKENTLINDYNNINTNNNNNMLEDLSKENKLLKDEIENNEKKYENLEKKYNELKEINNSMEKNQNINNKKDENINKLKEEINNNKNKITLLENQLKNKEKEYKLKVIDYDNLKNELSIKTNEFEQLKNVIDEEKNKYDKNILESNKNTSKVVDKLNNEINELKNDINKYKLQINEQDKIIKDYKDKINSNKNKNNNDEIIIENLKNEKKNLEINIDKTNNELNNVKKELSKKDDEYNSLSGENNHLKALIKEYKSQLKEEKENNSKIEELKSKNTQNIEKLNLQASQIGNYLQTINEKDELIKKLKSNYSEDDRITRFEKDIKELQEKNRILLEENNDLKQSKVTLIQSTNQQMIKNNQSLNEYVEKVRELEQEKLLLESQLEESKKQSMRVDNSVNFLYEEENIRYTNEIDNLKKKIKNLEKENKLLKVENEELKKKIDGIKKKEDGKCLTMSNNLSNFEEEYDVLDLANNAKEKNNSEDMKIDFPGLNDINTKYLELKKNIDESKELIKEIICSSQCEDPDIQQKVQRVCEILEINFE